MNAPSFAKWILLSLPLCFVGCRTGSNVTPIGGTVEPGGQGGNGALLVQGQGAYEAPPHLFSPRPHPPHQRFDPPAPNLSALPKLVNRIDRCYGGERPQPIASNGPKPPPRPPSRFPRSPPPNSTPPTTRSTAAAIPARHRASRVRPRGQPP